MTNKEKNNIRFTIIFGFIIGILFTISLLKYFKYL
jgi:hypothetical protein